MSSIFTKIINGEIPSYKILENDHFLAFLDVFPLAKGHCLVIPKAEVDNIFDLEDNALSELHLFSKKVAKAMEKSFDCLKIGVSVIGLEVPHAHIHLIPMNSVSDMNFAKDKLSFSKEEMLEVQQRIQSNL